MNRLLPGAPPAPMNEPAPAPSAASSPIPGQKAYMQAQARELGVPVRGTKVDIINRLKSRLDEHAGRVRTPRDAAPQVLGPGSAPLVPPMKDIPENRLLMRNAPAVVEQTADPFDETLAQFEAFLRAR